MLLRVSFQHVRSASESLVRHANLSSLAPTIDPDLPAVSVPSTSPESPPGGQQHFNLRAFYLGTVLLTPRSCVLCPL
jgi:hypothetical protein